MKTIIVLTALAAVALAAPSTLGDRTSTLDRTSSLRSWPRTNREKKSPTFGKLKGHHETEYHHHHHEPEYHHHLTPHHHLGLHPHPVHHGYGHGHHIFREDEKAAEDTKTTCAKEVEAKCGEKEAASEKDALILTSTEENQMRMIEEHERTLDAGIHTNIQAARLALDKMQHNLEDMERSASPKMQWKHADSKSDLSLNADIESARSALANVQKNIDELHNINEDTVAFKEAEIETSEFEKMTEEERMAHWREAIETIERNVEIADNIKKSFVSDKKKNVNDHQKSVMMTASENIESHQESNNKGKEMEMSASETTEVRAMKTAVEHEPTHKPEKNVSKLTEEQSTIVPSIKSGQIKTEATHMDTKLSLAKSSEITKEDTTLVHNDAMGNLQIMKEKEADVVSEKKLDDTLDHTTLARENTKHLQLMKVKEAELKESDAKLLNNLHKTSNLPREDVSIDFLRTNNADHTTNIEKKNKIHNMNHESATSARENIVSTKNINNNEEHNDMEHHESNIISMKAAVADETPSNLNVKASLSNTEKIENTQAILPHGKNAEVSSMQSLSLHHEMKHTKLSEDLKPLSMKAASSEVPHGRFADDMDMSMNMKAASSGIAQTHEMNPIRNNQKQELNRKTDFNQRTTGMNSLDHFHGHVEQMKAEPSDKLRSLTEKSSGGWRKQESSRTAYGPSVVVSPTGYGVGGGGSAGAGGAVGVFPNAHVSNCAVPLLLSCSPNVVSGHLAKVHHEGYGASAGGYGGSSHAAAAVSSGGYGAPAVHATPAGYGAPAVHAAPAGYGALAPALAPAPLSYSPYRSSEDFSFHNKRDVKKMSPKVRRTQKTILRNY